MPETRFLKETGFLIFALSEQYWNERHPYRCGEASYAQRLVKEKEKGFPLSYADKFVLHPDENLYKSLSKNSSKKEFTLGRIVPRQPENYQKKW